MTRSGERERARERGLSVVSAARASRIACSGVLIQPRWCVLIIVTLGILRFLSCDENVSAMRERDENATAPSMMPFMYGSTSLRKCCRYRRHAEYGSQL